MMRGRALPTLLVLTVLVGPPARGCPQSATTSTAPQNLPLPPDLIHVNHTGCHIDAHHSGQTVLNAKTGEEEDVVLWTVTPFAQYEALPDGTKREDWKPVAKDGSD